MMIAPRQHSSALLRALSGPRLDAPVTPSNVSSVPILGPCQPRAATPATILHGLLSPTWHSIKRAGADQTRGRVVKHHADGEHGRQRVVTQPRPA